MEANKMYDAITQAYFEDEETEFDGVDINDHPILKTVAYLLDAAITIGEAEDTSIKTLMWNFIEIEIQTLQRMQRVFE